MLGQPYHGRCRRAHLAAYGVAGWRCRNLNRSCQSRRKVLLKRRHARRRGLGQPRIKGIECHRDRSGQRPATVACGSARGPAPPTYAPARPTARPPGVPCTRVGPRVVQSRRPAPHGPVVGATLRPDTQSRTKPAPPEKGSRGTGLRPAASGSPVNRPAEPPPCCRSERSS